MSFLGVGWVKHAIVALIVLGLPVSGYIKGRADGVAASETERRAAIEKLQSDLDVVNARSKEQVAQIIKAEEYANALANELEATALKDVDANRVALPARSVRRIFGR